MPKKKTKVSKKKVPARKKVRRRIENPAKTLTVLLDRAEEVLAPTLAPTDVYHQAQAEEAKARAREAEAKARERVMEVEKKIFENAISQARQLLDDELALALKAMRARAAKGGRDLELLAAQEPGYLAYVLTAEVARTVNRVRPDIRCEDLLALVKELPR